MQYANIAKHFAAEKIKNYEFPSRFHKGKINLPPMTPPPEYVENLYLENTADSKNFKGHIRQYYNAFASMGMRKNGNSETIILRCAPRA